MTTKYNEAMQAGRICILVVGVVARLSWVRKQHPSATVNSTAIKYFSVPTTQEAINALNVSLITYLSGPA